MATILDTLTASEKKQLEAEAPTQKGKEWYHLGLTEDAPIDSLTVAGFALQKYTNRLVQDPVEPSLMTPGPPHAGAVIKLTDAQAAAIRSTVLEFVLQHQGRVDGVPTDKHRCKAHRKQHVQYSPGMDDEPLAKYVYIDKLKDDDEAEIRRNRPFRATIKTGRYVANNVVR